MSDRVFAIAFHITHLLHHWQLSTPDERGQVTSDLSDDAASTVAQIAEAVLERHNARMDQECAELGQSQGLPQEETAPIFDDADALTAALRALLEGER